MMTGTVCFEQKKLLFCNAKFRDFGANGDRGKFVVESATFGIADPDLPIHYATFMGLRWRLRVLSAPIVKHFRSKKLSPILGQILTVLGDK